MTEPRPIPVNSATFEYVYVANQRCECGGRYKVMRQELLTFEGMPVDRLAVVCTSCDQERHFEFDVSSFFGDFEKYGRYRETEAHFQQAVVHIQARDWPAAEEELRRVVDPEEGEPAFAWAHYHLGMVLLMQKRVAEALPHLEHAVAIQPLEADMHEGLGRVYRASGREADALSHFYQAQELRTRFTSQDNHEEVKDAST